MSVDPVALAQELIRTRSVTPDEAGALSVVERALTSLGFRAQRLKFGEVDNLYARLGNTQPNFCFAGHVDVVPPGEGWSGDPFSGDVRDGKLYGRGASDMKAAIAAMIAASDAYVRAHGVPNGSISFLLTCDEEGPAVDGTVKVLQALAADGEMLDHCLIGEPTSAERFGDVIKNGRRGSLNAVITMLGKQGHVAYPHLAANPVTALIEACATLKARKLDDGAPGFDPSNLEVTSVDVGNPTSNIIPAKAEARLNIRFNTAHRAEDLQNWIEQTAHAAAVKANIEAQVRVSVSGHPFYTEPGAFTRMLERAVEAEIGAAPHLSTSGGTSDARFIKAYCPVAEFGMLNATAHKIDEHVATDDILALTRIYARVLDLYFSGAAG